MYKYLLAESGNINWMAIFALLTFLAVFVITIWVTFKKSPDFIKKMENMPLTETENHENN
jgi:hypothetical protein